MSITTSITEHPNPSPSGNEPDLDGGQSKPTGDDNPFASLFRGSFGTGDEIIVDPASLGERGGSVDATDEQPRKRRGRKPGSKTKAKDASNLKDIIGSAFYIGHAYAHKRFKHDQWAMSEEEATKIGGAFDDVLSEYNYTVSDKTKAWANLCTVLGVAYGGRVFDFYAHGGRKQQPQVAAPSGFAGFGIPGLQGAR